MTKPSHFADDPRPARYRATFTLPIPLCKNIAALAKRLGVSQSALLAELLDKPIQAMIDVVGEIPVVGATPEHVMRARGKSSQLIRDVVQQALAVAKALDPDDHSAT